jgi:dihydrofolate reductase
MKRRVMYQVAMSADGYIAGPHGEHDWISMDPSIDFIAQCGQFDTAIMGRATYAKAIAMHGDAALPGLDVVVFSRTLSPGPDIAIMPVVLGKGTKLFETALAAKFALVDHVVLENSGVVVLRYAVADRLNGMPRINYVRRETSWEHSQCADPGEVSIERDECVGVDRDGTRRLDGIGKLQTQRRP